MESSAGEDEIADNGGALTLAKRKRQAIDGTSSDAGGVCDDTVCTILARLPARTAIACTALSKRHRTLIRSPEFRSLHCRLGAPLPSPHIAYLATAPIRRRPEHNHASSWYYGFHLAGSGPGLTVTGSGDAPIRSVAGWRYLGTEYVNTCNGVLLLATEGFSDPCQCTLWNPAIADAAREATIPRPSLKKKSQPIIFPDGTELSHSHKETHLLALGLGYGWRSNTYKLLWCRRDTSQIQMFFRRDGKIVARRTGGPTHHFEYSLVVHSLGGGNDTADEETLTLRTVLSMEPVQSYKAEVGKEIIQQKSLYMEGKIYFLYLEKDEILTFNVDDETVHSIDMPSKCQEAAYARRSFELIEMSGRPCLVITEYDCVALWLLTANYQLEPMHAISYEKISGLYNQKIVGIWDCGGILFLWFDGPSTDKLLLYDVTAKKIFRANLPHDLTVNKSEYMLCWGYKPTLVLPESIVTEFNQNMERQRGRLTHITEVINPLLLQDRRKGQEVTLNIVCLMEFLVRIMHKLPHDLQDVVDSEEPGSLF